MVHFKNTFAFPLLLLAFVPLSASGSIIWTEDGDAGDLPATANATRGMGGLEAIVGTLPFVDIVNDDPVDMFEIYIDDTSTFSATTDIAGTDLLESWLYLFDDQGHGVAAGASSLGGSFNATISQGSVSGPRGNYYLAVTKFEAIPNSTSGAIFPDLFLASTNGEVVGSTGPGGTDPLEFWNTFPLGDFSNYRIELTGAGAAQSSTVIPEPSASIVWIALGATACASFWQRRKTR